MKNFFEQQDDARKATRWLGVWMAFGVVGIATALYFLLLVVLILQQSRGSVEPVLSLWHPRLFFATLAGTALLVSISSGVRMLSLRKGGRSVAEMLGGRLVTAESRDPLERRLFNVVEEMSIASGVPLPQVYVLDHEAGINAFAAGHSLDDAVIAVTRGSLEKLARDELQGVVAHEFSHILNGDMRLNIRLMGVVFGMVCLTVFGRLILRLSHSSRSSRSQSSGSARLVIALLGLGFLMIGFVGQLFSKMIQSATSRAREYLADASAVQFTRNPPGIAGALKKIGGFREGSRVESSHAEEARHFFFSDSLSQLSSRVFATHPPLLERIQRIDPAFNGTYANVPDGVLDPPASTAPLSASAAGFATSQPITRAPQHIVAEVGQVTEASLHNAQTWLDAIEKPVLDAANNPFSACALMYALLLSSDAALRNLQKTQLAQNVGARMMEETTRLEAHTNIAKEFRLSVVDIASSTLRELTPPQRAVFFRGLDVLIHADNQLEPFEFVLSHLLYERLGEKPRTKSEKIQNPKAVLEECTLLLSVLAWAGHTQKAEAERAFALGAQRFANIPRLTLLEPHPRLLQGLSEALHTLRNTAPKLRSQIVDALAHVVFADQVVKVEEAELLRAVCEALQCPLPPFQLQSAA